MRITLQYLKEWLQKEFDRLGIDLQVKAIHRTNCRPTEYESGAAYYILRVGEKDVESLFTIIVYVFYPLSYLQKELNNGHELFFQLKDGKFINESEINIRKKV